MIMMDEEKERIVISDRRQGQEISCQTYDANTWDDVTPTTACDESVSEERSKSSLPTPPHYQPMNHEPRTKAESQVAESVRIAESAVPFTQLTPSNDSTCFPCATLVEGNERLVASSIIKKEIVNLPPVQIDCDPKAFSSPAIHPSEYSDRVRLLYHITHLATQCQRAQLQIQEQYNSLVILNEYVKSLEKSNSTFLPVLSKKYVDPSTTPNQKESIERDEYVKIMISQHGFTAAVMAAENEAALQREIADRLPLFDPLLAQQQIQRLDDALAHVSLLREAEMNRASTAEKDLQTYQEKYSVASKNVDRLQKEKELLEQRCSIQAAELKQIKIELERMQLEEQSLNRQMASLTQFQAMNRETEKGLPVDVRVESSSEEHPISAIVNPLTERLNALVHEEQEARQALLLSVFWEPVVMAFDAGIAWLSGSQSDDRDDELVKLREALRKEEAIASKRHNGSESAWIDLGILSNASKSHMEISLHDETPLTTSSKLSTDLLLRHQQIEFQETQLKLEQTEQRLRLLEMEKQRLELLYQNEKKHAAKMSEDHLRQVKNAYKEILKDREIIKGSLEQTVEQQVRTAFSEGRIYERELQRNNEKGSKHLHRK